MVEMAKSECVERNSNIQERDLMSGMDTANGVAKRKTLIASFSNLRDFTKFCVRWILLSRFKYASL